MTSKEAFTTEEWEELKMSTTLMVGFVASADGTIDDQERKAGIKETVEDAALYKEPLVREVLLSQASDFAASGTAALDRVKQFMDSHKGLEGTLRAFRETAAILDKKCTPDESRHFKSALIEIGIKVAKASGGTFWHPEDKMSDDEAKACLLALEALGAEEIWKSMADGTYKY